MEINVKKENGCLTFVISGHVDSNNIAEVDAVVNNEPVEEFNEVYVDARNLDYISSAGLRTILSLKKRTKTKPFAVINVNSAVKEIFDVTGFSDIMDVKGVTRQVNVDGLNVIGRGACGECYRIDDETIVKLYFPKVKNEEITREKELSKKAFVLGVPTAISYDIIESKEGRLGVVYELINSKTITEMIREGKQDLDSIMNMYVKMCKDIHAIEVHDEAIPDFKEVNRIDIGTITGITEEERALLHKFLDLVPEGHAFNHGDLNPNNIMVQNNEPCLIDMGEIGTGTPLFDISRIIFSMDFFNPKEGMNTFYNMPSEEVTKLLNIFLEKYFGNSDLTKVDYPNIEWLYPLAWFRCIASWMKNDRQEKRKEAEVLLREHLIPFLKTKI